MNYESDWFSDVRETSESLLQDVLLLEAMTLRIEHKRPWMTNVPPEMLEKTYHRLLDYLSQHVMDLYFLNRQLTQS